MSVWAKQTASEKQLMPLPFDDEFDSPEMDDIEKIYWGSQVPYN